MHHGGVAIGVGIAGLGALALGTPFGQQVPAVTGAVEVPVYWRPGRGPLVPAEWARCSADGYAATAVLEGFERCGR